MSIKRFSKDTFKTEAKINPKQSTQKTKGNEQSKNISSKADKEQQKKNQRKVNRKNRRPVRRIFPIWLRLIIVLLLSGIALILGLMFGYGFIGDGNPMDALKIETWQHIKDIVKKKE